MKYIILSLNEKNIIINIYNYIIYVKTIYKK